MFPEVQKNHLCHPIPRLLYEPLHRSLRSKKILQVKLQYFVPCSLTKTLVNEFLYDNDMQHSHDDCVEIIIYKEKEELIDNIRIWE